MQEFSLFYFLENFPLPEQILKWVLTKYFASDMVNYISNELTKQRFAEPTIMEKWEYETI